MDLLWIVIIYLLFGILMGEGLLYHDRKHGKKTLMNHYLIALLLGPSVGLLVLLWNAMFGKKS